MVGLKNEKMVLDARRGQAGERAVRFGTANEPDGTRNEADGVIFSFFMGL